MGKKEETSSFPSPPHQQPYYALPAQPPDDPHHYAVLVPYYPSSLRRRIARRSRNCSCFLTILTVIALSATAIFFLWPSHPDLTVVRLHLNHVAIKSPSSNALTLEISIDLTVKVRNRDFFSVDYRSLFVSLGYRGRELGFVTSGGGRVKARGVSYVDANLRLDGVEVLHDVFYLIADVASGSIPFDTLTEFQGYMGLLFFDFPLVAKLSCEVYVNTGNQTISHQDCSPA